MKIILTAPIQNLGQIGNIVTVKDGYARNFLIPNNFAKKFSKQELEKFNQRKQELEKISAEQRDQAQKIMEKLKDLTIKIHKKSSMEGNLYGSISNKDILDALKQENINVESRQIVMHQRIKSLGDYKVKLSLYAEIIADINLLVVASNT